MNTTRSKPKGRPVRTRLSHAIGLVLLMGSAQAAAATFTVTTNQDSGPGSLREAVGLANANPGEDTIEFAPGLGLIELTGGQIDVTESLIIDGDGFLPSITAAGQSRIFAMDAPGEHLQLLGLSLTQGGTTASGSSNCSATTGAGGAMCVIGNLSLIESDISGSVTTGSGADGGAVFVADGDLTLIDSTISGNRTEGDYARGGGAYLNGGLLELIRSTISDNATWGHHARGGGLFHRWDLGDIVAAQLSDCVIADNHTRGDWALGGGALIDASTVLTDCQVSGNWTEGEDARGGGLAVREPLQADGLVVSGNRTEGAYAYGGGLLLEDNAVFSNATISGNSTLGDNAAGGGLHVNSGELTIEESTLSGNVTFGNSADGGGLYAQELIMRRSRVAGNRTEGVGSRAGGVRAEESVFEQVLISGNSTLGTDGDGGGLRLSGFSEISDSLISNNLTAGDGARGGGLMARQGVVIQRSSLIGNRTEGNEAPGGALYVRFALELVNSTLAGNATQGSLDASGGAVAFFVNAGGQRGFGSPEAFSIHNSSIAGNSSTVGGALWLEVEGDPFDIDLVSSVVAGNSGPAGNLDALVGGSWVINASHSVFGDPVGELNGSNQANIFTDQPRLISPADNGCVLAIGPGGADGCAPTMAPRIASPVLNAGANPLLLTGDQRGFDRERLGQPDIGAFELQADGLFSDRFEP